MPSQGDQLVEFLRARYTEARQVQVGNCVIPSGLPIRWTHVFRHTEEFVLIEGAKRMSVDAFYEQYGEPAPDPDVLADLDAKLAILDLHARLDDLPFCVTCDAPSGIPGQPEGCSTLRVLAVPFAAHPDYDERWRP